MCKNKSWIDRLVVSGLISFISICLLFTGTISAQPPSEFKIGETIYENPLSGPEDIEDWIIESSKEGQPVITESPVNQDMLRLQSQVHFLLWCPEDFPDNIAVSWDFKPIARVDGRGLAMFWMSVTAKNGIDIFDPSLEPREGHYHQYRGEMNALHLSYFRRNKNAKVIHFPICSLRKSRPANNGPRVAQAADPIPCIPHVVKPFRLQVIKYGPYFQFTISDSVTGVDLVVLEWEDKGEHGPVLKGGKIGFRQMRGLIADYANLRVQRVYRESEESVNTD